MKFYKKITVFENLKRTKFLLSFKDDVIQYFAQRHHDSYNFEHWDTEESLRIRSSINERLSMAQQVVSTSDLATFIYYNPPQQTGAIAGELDLLQNIFNLSSFKIDIQQVLDLIERSTGNYKADKICAVIRTINPFFWIGLVLDYLVSIPFRLIGKMGFDGNKIELSMLGRAIKGILYFITVFASFLEIMNLLGWLSHIKKIIPKL